MALSSLTGPIDLQNSAEREPLTGRAKELFDEQYRLVLRRTDRLFMWLILAEWLVAMLFAYWLSPYAWAGKTRVVHTHVYAAVLLGGAITSLPVLLAWLRPGEVMTRYVVASGQMLMSALLIHLTGGRIETHFHVFGSLAILAFYRDLRVLVPATVIVAVDHFVRGIYWPESVYGVTNPEWWRFLEHAGWVVFIDVFLVLNCVQSYRELEDLSERQAEVELSRETLLRTERLAAIGQLAASVGHELRNPLAAVRNAHNYLCRKLPKDPGDAKVGQFLDIMKRELDASARIISNLLEFSRPRELTTSACPLGPLVEEAVSVIPTRDNVRIVNSVPDELPVPEIDKDQFRQVLVNLVQNAVEAMPPDHDGLVEVSASGGGKEPWRITVRDNGPGIAAADVAKVFQPLYTTKTKGTGLGLAIVRAMVERHRGELTVESVVGEGAAFRIELPAA